MSLLLSLAACEGFPGFERRDEPLPPPIIIEVPMPQVEAEPEPEKPMAPLPARKPAAAMQAKREQPANGHGGPNGDTGNGHGAHGSAPSESAPPGHSAAAGAEASAPPPEPPPVMGLNRNALVAQFGSPVSEHAAAPARVLEFGGDECRLAAYLYFDTARNDFYVLQYQVNGMSDRNEAADRCLMRIRDAARR